MSRISDLEGIAGNSVNSEDLFVTVNLVQGIDGTKKITRSEIVNAIQKDTFTDLKATGGNLSNFTLNNFEINNLKPYVEIASEDYFILKDVSTNSTVQFTFADLEDAFSDILTKTNKIYVSEDGYPASEATGSYSKPYSSLDEAFTYINTLTTPISISILPGTYYTNGYLSLPDNSSVIGTNGQYATNIIMNDGFEQTNCFLIGSGCYVQGLSFQNLVIDNFDDPTVGFAIAFRPDAKILRSPYIRDVSQISNYRREPIAAPLNPRNSLGNIDDLGGTDFPNPLVGRGGGVLLADRSVLDSNSIFPYMLAFGATPRSPNGIGYVAKNGAGINGIGSITVFQRCAFYALNGGQITLNNSGTQFGDISMRAKGSTEVVEPYETSETLIISPSVSAQIDSEFNTIIDDTWDYLIGEGYTVNEESTRRDARNLLQSISYDFLSGSQTSTRNFVLGFFGYNAEHVFSVFNPTDEDFIYKGSVSSIGSLPSSNNTLNDAYIVYNDAAVPLNIYSGNVYYWNGSSWVNDGANDTTLLDAFIDSFNFILEELRQFTSTSAEEDMLDALFDDILIPTLLNPSKLVFGSLIESIGHQFNLAGAGVNKNALPLNFRRVGQPLAASGSVLEEDGGRVRWSGADELNNQYFARGLKINGRTGRLEGRPFTSSVRRLARRAANSRTFT